MENPLSLEDSSLLIEFMMCEIEMLEKLVPKARKNNPIRKLVFCMFKVSVSWAIEFGLYSEAVKDKTSWLIIIEIKPNVSAVDLFRYLSEMYPIKIGNRYARP